MIVNAGGQQFTVSFDHATYCPMRRVLDHLLVTAAVEAGAELKERFRVTDVVREDGRVVGVRGVSGEVEETLHGQIVVGADGRRSTVARRVEAKEYDHVPMSGGGVYAYFENVPVAGYEFYYGDAFAMLAPSNEGLTHVATAGEQVRGSSQERFDRVLDTYPELARRVRQGRRSTRLVAYRDAPVFFRQAFGLGWALVGDVGFHQGPWNGHGMSHAFRDAERLAVAIDEWLSGSRGFEEALGGYSTDRDECCRPFRDNIRAIVEALQAGRPQDAPWGGEWPHVQRWVQRILSSEN
jgi:flavin-dependent dehydrogenase